MWMQSDGCACTFKTSPWQAIRLYRLAGTQLKQEGGLPDSIAALADGTTGYEAEIRTAWDAYKLDPTHKKAEEFIDYLVMISGAMWPEVMAAVLGIAADELTVDQQQVLQDALDEHHAYMRESLLPDITRYQQLGKLDSLDYRTIVLYAGALWQFGNLATVMFDGTKLRDLADLFMFAGPNDSETCTGERGCQSHANRVYTVAQILTEEIIPGRMRCLTNCRHFLLPLASPLKGVKKHQAGRHDQSTHTPRKYGRGKSPESIPGMAEYNQLAQDREWIRHPIMDDSWEVNRNIAPGVEAGERKDGKFGLCACHSLNAHADDPSLKVMVGISMDGDDQERLVTHDHDQYWEPRFLGTVHVWNEDSQGRVVDNAVGSRNAKRWKQIYIGKEVPKDVLDGFADDGQLLNYAHDTVNASNPVSKRTEAEYTKMWEHWRERKHKHQMGRHDQRRHTPRAYRSVGTRLTPAYFTEGKGKYLFDQDMPQAHKDLFIGDMMRMGVTEEDLDGLNEITTRAGANYRYNYTDVGPQLEGIHSGQGVNGFYDPPRKNVHISLERVDHSWMEAEGFDIPQAEKDAYLATAAEQRAATLLHEIGHHASMAGTGRLSDPEVQRKFMRQDQAGALANVLSQEIGDTDYHHQLPTVGLRPYSLTNEREMLADTYKVMRTGSYSQRDELTRLWRQAGFIEQDETLENVFKGEMVQVDEIVSYEPGDGTIGVVSRPVTVDIEIVVQTPWYYVGARQARLKQVRLKHQAGRHDQQTHTPKKYGEARRLTSMADMRAYLKGNNLVPTGTEIEGGYVDMGHITNPTPAQLEDALRDGFDQLVDEYGYEEAARKTEEGFPAYYDPRTGSLAVGLSPWSHGQLGESVVGDLAGEHQVSVDLWDELEERSVHVVIKTGPDANFKPTEFGFNAWQAGDPDGPWAGDYDKAMGNVYRAMDSLAADGYAKDTPVFIDMGRQGTMGMGTDKVQTTLKHQMGRHDQRTHTPEAYRGQGVVPEKPGPKPYVPERVRELMDPESETNQQAAKDWKNLSHADRMKLADPDAMDRGMAENLRRYREEVEIPHDLKGQKLTTKTYDQVAANTQARIDSLQGALTPVTEAQLREYADTHMRKAVEQGLKDKSLKMDAGQLDDMMAKNVDKLVHQEIEARKRQLGDHGIRHVVGNVRAVNAMLDDPDLPATTGLQRMMALQTMVDHDMGYTVGVVAASIPATEYHPQYSEKYAKAQGYEKLFGAGNAKEMTRMVREHAGTDLDWEKDTLMSAVRTADNTALFNREKLPALFYDVPGATDELYRLQLAQVGGTGKEATPKVQENLRKLVTDSAIDDRHKAELMLAVDEVSPYTGKFSLGMASGEIEGYDYKKDGLMYIKVKGKPERELLTGLFDLGDRQFDKFAEAYDTTGNPSVGGLDFSKGGKKVLHIDYEEPTRKATGTLATMYDDSVRPDIRLASRQAGPTSTLTDRERAWPMIQANVKGKLTAGEMAEFERRFKAGTLDDMPLTERERSYLTKLKEMLKHLPGRHDQKAHSPYKNLPASVGQLDTYLKGHDIVQPSGSWDSPGYVLNPSSPAELVNNYLPTEGSESGRSIVSGFYDTETGAIVFALEETSHPSLAGSVVGEYSKTTADMVKGLEDRSVHIVAELRGDSITNVDFGVGRAGIAWRAGDLPLDENEAIDNVYRAMDKLGDWGLPDDTPVYIQRHAGGNIQTTIKHLAGRHDQRSHGYRYGAGVTMSHLRRQRATMTVEQWTGFQNKAVERLAQLMHMSVVYVWKHLAGQHDQQAHTPKKYAGATRQVSGLGRVRDRDTWDYEATDKGANEMFLTLVEEVVPPHMSWRSLEGRSEVKRNTVQALADQTGLEYDRVNELVKTWAHTSNDHDPVSLGFQQAAADTFGVELSEWQKQKINETVDRHRKEDGTWEFVDVELFDNSRRDSAKVLEAMYDNTQVELKAAGLKEVTLYRGMTQPKGADPRLGDEYDIGPNAVGSWSLDYNVAENFASRYGDPDVDGVVLKMAVPAERIVSTPFTGSGCLTEKEFLVAGRPVGASGYDRALVSHVSYAPEPWEEENMYEPGPMDLPGLKELSVVLIGSSILNSDWIKYVRDGQAQADDLAAHDYAGTQLKHMPGKHDQRFHTPHRYRTATGAHLVGHEAEQAKRREALGPIVGKVESAVRSKWPELEQEDPEMFGQYVQDYLDMMALDEQRFMRYSNKLGLGLTSEDASEFMWGMREASKDRQRAIWKWKNQSTATDDRGFKRFMSGLDVDLEQRANAYSSGSAQAAKDKLARDYGVQVNNVAGIEDDVLQRDLDRLIGIAEAHPAVGRVVKDDLEAVNFHVRKAGDAARADAGIDNINVYKERGQDIDDDWGGIYAYEWTHEVGHVADKYEYDWSGWGKGRHVSTYAWENFQEDFAETWNVSLSSGPTADGYRKQVPDKLARMDALVAQLASLEDIEE
jgi:hypothetical protein